MKKTTLNLLFFGFCFLTLHQRASAQIICIYCYDQNDSISDNVNNFITNGSFESSTCTPYPAVWDVYCPNASQYSCDIANWTCTGGGTGTYSMLFDNTITTVPDGNVACYFGNSYCQPCSQTVDDTSCFTNVDCTVTGIPVGYPQNGAAYGGATGISIEQTVTGLTIGSTYVLEFWTGGEAGGFVMPGVFGVDIGFGYTMLRNPPTIAGATGKVYIIEFNATATSHTIKFTNWGHACSSCTELVLDMVRLYPVADLSSSIPPCAGTTITALFTAPNHICPGTCTNFTNLSQNGTSYLWTFAGANPSTSTDVNPTNICYNTPGNYPVSLIATNTTSSDTLTLNNYITVYPYPPPQGISQNGDTLFANAGAVSYQWYYNGVLIPGATDYFYVHTDEGDYNVVATDPNNCEVEAVIFDVPMGVQSSIRSLRSAVVFPNPVKEKLEIRNWKFEADATISIYNMLGEKVLDFPTSNIQHPTSIDVSQLQSSIYYIEISSGQKTFRSKFIKQ